MKFLALFALFAVAASRHMLFDQQLNEHWENFKKTFGKQYNGGEELMRRTIWERRVADIVRHNLQYDLGLHSYRKGINEYSDMEHEEFVKTFNGYRGLVNLKSNASTWVPPSNVRIPDKVDWRDQGLVTPVKNQQQCGSCWAFSTTGSLEGQHMKKTGQLVSLSEQNLVDCSGPEGNQGCEGGLMDQAFQYIKENSGIDTEKSYPYTAQDGTCHFKKADVGATVTGYVDIPSGDEDALKKAVATVGPISVAIDASHDSFQTYQDGVYDEPECSPDQLDHGVLIVGYGTEDGSDYWLVKNSKDFLKIILNKFSGNQGCEGGLMDQAFEYIKENRGIDTEASYPYIAQDGTCHFKKADVGATVTGYVDIPTGDEDALKKAVATVGPISVAIDASHDSFQTYQDGIYVEPECSPDQLDHGVLIVGYGSEDGSDYWLVKNSWGKTWGIKGYIKMARNKDNQCGIATQASYPLV
ncbi:cathepsin L [Caerostris darwini]|uniref:Cathepsin L n=1 Tax=Caerostris darwini TaxID=1538125 RepID=A0AAV4QKD0_9ARAC|nr:cathepsin L [Caerostris darwini]